MSTDAPVPAAPTTESPTANTAPPQVPTSDEAAPLPSATSDLPESEPLTPEILEEEAQRGDFVLRWAVVLMALLYGFTHIAATPTLVLVKTGQHLLTHGLIPSGKALFSTLAEGRTWTDFSWGFEILSAAIFNASGFTGLTVAKALVAALIFGIVVHTSRKNVPSLWTSIVAAAGILATHSHFSATPNLITLLGLALVLFGVLRWRDRETETTHRGTLYWLIPVFLVWGNLDPRAYLGIALLGLYTLGTALSMLIKRNGAKPNLKHLGIVLGASLAVLVIHPSPAAPLLAPFHIYGAEYPAFRVFLGQTALPNRLEFYPAYAPGVAQSLDLGTFVAIGLLVAFILMVVLQALDADLGLVLSVLGFAGIAVMGLRELPAAALVTTIATAWMGQSWFAQSFKLDYAVTTWNIFFSRGARAVAVLGLAALAFFGGTDRLRMANSGHTGWGLDPAIQATLESLKTQLQDAPDDHPFHYTMFQGDELIWLGRKAFIDTRAGLYFGRGDEDLVTVFAQTRDSLRTPRKTSPLAGITTADKSVKWETVLDKYKVTHAVITLEDQTFIGVPTFQSMLTMGRTGKWIVSDFGALSATLARTDVDTPELVKYRTEHTFDPVKLAFTEKMLPTGAKPDAVDLTTIPPRTSVQEPPTFYDSLWQRPRETSGPILRALNLVRLSGQNDREMPWDWHQKRDALALLGIQEAQRALEQSPSPKGHLALGLGYMTLLQMDSVQFPLNLRYYQAASELQQVLAAEPHNIEAHLALQRLYMMPFPVADEQGNIVGTRFRNLELTLREFKYLDANFFSAAGDLDAIQARSEQRKLIKKLEDEVNEIKAGLAGAKQDNTPVMQLAQAAYFRGLSLTAIQYLDSDSRSINDASAQLFKGMLQLENGQVAEALRIFDLFGERAGMESEFWEIIGLAKLVRGEHTEVSRRWSDGITALAPQSVFGELDSLRPYMVTASAAFPMPMIGSTMEFLYGKHSAQLADRHVSLALVQLENGQIHAAEANLRKALEIDPETNLRPTIGRYLYRITGDDYVIDVQPPSSAPIRPEFVPEKMPEPASK